MLLLPFLVVIIAQPEYYSWYKASLINFDFEFSWRRFCLSHFVFDSFRPGWEFSNRSEAYWWSDIIFDLGFGWC